MRFSLDLPAPGAAARARDALAIGAWFAPGAGGAVDYENADTGVRAEFQVADDRIGVVTELARPTYWGTELANVVGRVATRAGLPSPDDVADRWATENDVAWARAGTDDRVVVPDHAVARWWRWNVALLDLRPLYPGAQVPAMRLIDVGRGWQTAAIWTDLGDILLPPVDVVLVLGAATIARGVPAGLSVLEPADVDRLAGPPADDGAGGAVLGAATSRAWLDAARRARPVEGRPPQIHPVDAVEASRACRRPDLPHLRPGDDRASRRHDRSVTRE